MLPPLLILVLAGRAEALDIDTFAAGGSGLAGLGGLELAFPALGAPGSGYGGVLVAFAAAPYLPPGGPGDPPERLGLGSVHLVGGTTVGSGLRVDVDLRGYPSVGPFHHAAFGDLHLGAVAPLFRGAPLGLALTSGLTLPTGDVDEWVGAGGVGASVGMAGGGRVVEHLEWVANLGYTTGPAVAVGDLRFGSRVDAGVGAAWLVTETLRVGAEVDTRVEVLGGLDPLGRDPVEGHLYASYGGSQGPASTFGVGTTLARGLGAPDLRVVAGLVWRGQAAEDDGDGGGDGDGDGLPDPTDICPQDPEDRDGVTDADGCPDIDDDGDRVLDPADRCPDAAEDRDNLEDFDGCPEDDADKDQTVDAQDACPEDPGPPAGHGCPDIDGDSVEDKLDECPEDRGPVSTHGCPEGARLGTGTIDLGAPVNFDPGTAVLSAESLPVLDTVGALLVNHPEIRKVEIRGHTDDSGNEAANLRLSQARADAVKLYLVTIGHVEAGRLHAIGRGDTEPVDTNYTKAGRARNRRVEFIVVDRE